MKKFLLILALFINISADDDVDPCTSSYESLKETTCQSLHHTGLSAQCSYSNNNCKKGYTECSQYAPSGSETFKSEVCTSILPTDGNYICEVKTGANNAKTCEPKLKTCSQHDERDTCVNLDAGTGQRCVLFEDDKCEAHSESCTGLEQTKCAGNIPKDKSKICEWTSGTSGSCGETNRKCENYQIFYDKYSTEYTTGTGADYIPCVSLTAETNQRCILRDDSKTCEGHYTDCANANKNEDTCKNNIPKDNTNYCKWVAGTNGAAGSCETKPRLCNNFIFFTDGISTNENSCLQLAASDSLKTCYLTGDNKCEETYTDCSSGSGEGKESICKGINILNDVKDGFIKTQKCSYSGTTCTQVTKDCNEYEYDENEDTPTICGTLTLDDSTNKVCVYDESLKRCDAKPLTCDSYNNIVSDTTKRIENDCKKITPGNKDTNNNFVEDKLSYCYYEESTCKLGTKSCEQITDQETCNSQTSLTDKPNKRCLYLKNAKTCVETYNKCEDYNNDATATTKSRDVCELIQPIYDNSANPEGYKYNCTFVSTTTGGTTSTSCERKKIDCEEYKLPGEQYTCEDLTTNFESDIRSKMQCKERDGKCVKEYKGCSSYTDGDKATCESIKIDSDYKRCFLEDDMNCEERKKLCSEYTGDSSYYCENYYRALSKNKICVFEDNKCIEKYPYISADTFSYCSNYRGTSRTECEAIQSPYGKCYYDETYGCMRQQKCSEGKSEIECYKIIPKDSSKKQCAYINGQCIEQYKTCTLYQDNVNTNDFSQTDCENIRINDQTNGQTYLTHFCEYNAGSSSSSKTCTSKARECTDFTLDTFPSKCSGLTISDVSKKCVYENNACSSKAKTCLELNYISSIVSSANLEEICENAATSSNDKICQPNSRNNGCEEAIKIKEDTNEECKCSGSEKYLSGLLLGLLFCLLV